MLFKPTITMTIYKYRKSEDETSKVFSCLRPICQLKSTRLLIVMASLLSLSYAIVFTQSNNNNYAFALSNNNTNSSKNTGLVQSSNNSNSTIPIMTKISNNGTYLVQLKWSNPTSLQSPNIPANKGFDMEVLFLNASAPLPNATHRGKQKMYLEKRFLMQVVLISQKYYNDRCLLTAMIYLFMITKVMFFGIRLTKCHEQGVDLKE